MTLALPDKWIWDNWYVQEGSRWHAFFLQADKALGDPDLRHFHVSIGHAISDDLMNWEHLGTCFAPAEEPGWDDATTWTGSVVRGDDGLWHLFYTGTSKAEGALVQRIGHATSEDLHDWRRQGLCLDLTGPNAGSYELNHERRWHDRACRDPFAMRDPGGGWLMAFTARASSAAEPNAAGAIGLATSSDLFRWELQPPVFTGGFGQLEVPQIFEHEGRWYALFCTFAEHWSAAQSAGQQPVSGIHYLIGEGPRGPWRIGPGFLDGANPARRYAGHILPTAGGLRLMSFADGGKAAFGGYVTDPVPVHVSPEGLLSLAP